jgi:hypothetical protein
MPYAKKMTKAFVEARYHRMRTCRCAATPNWLKARQPFEKNGGKFI